MKTTFRIGIVGGAGYTGGELLRLLLAHPQVEIAFVHSNSQAGKPVVDVHQDLLGETDLVFTDQLLACDVVFLCVGHGESHKFLEKNPISAKIIDLSQDYRLATADWVYGLPELNLEKIKKAQNIANPGCFATAIQLALLPLAKNQLLNTEIHVNAITGSTGSGQKPSENSHFSWRNNNISVYKPFEHQHLAEIRQSLTHLQPNFSHDLNFIPYRGNFTRGIYATTYLNVDLSLTEAQKLFENYYQNAPFVKFTDKNPDLKQVVNTNKCVIHLEKHQNKLFIISMIDNLLKGASGQALQNMNLVLGMEQTLGLRIKGVAF